MTARRQYPGPDKAPYRDGDLQEWAGYGFGEGERTDSRYEWRDNIPFPATLTITGIERGRSAIRFLWEDQYGHRYPMFAVDMVDLITIGGARQGGIVEGKWIVMKRGANYGIARYDG